MFGLKERTLALEKRARIAQYKIDGYEEVRGICYDNVPKIYAKIEPGGYGDVIFLNLGNSDRVFLTLRISSIKNLIDKYEKDLSKYTFRKKSKKRGTKNGSKRKTRK